MPVVASLCIVSTTLRSIWGERQYNLDKDVVDIIIGIVWRRFSLSQRRQRRQTCPKSPENLTK